MIASPPLLPRLLDVALACRDAFAEAAFVVRSPRLGSLFVRRAEHQQRIVDFLQDEIAKPATSWSSASPVTRPLSPGSRVGALPSSGEPYTILVSCLRVLDASIHEFARAFGPALPLAQRISLERHHDQMRWSRDELETVRRSYRASHATVPHDGRHADVAHDAWDERAATRADRWFGTLGGAAQREDRWFR